MIVCKMWSLCLFSKVTKDIYYDTHFITISVLSQSSEYNFRSPYISPSPLTLFPLVLIFFLKEMRRQGSKRGGGLEEAEEERKEEEEE